MGDAGLAGAFVRPAQDHSGVLYPGRLHAPEYRNWVRHSRPRLDGGGEGWRRVRRVLYQVESIEAELPVALANTFLYVKKSRDHHPRIEHHEHLSLYLYEVFQPIPVMPLYPEQHSNHGFCHH